MDSGEDKAREKQKGEKGNEASRKEIRRCYFWFKKNISVGRNMKGKEKTQLLLTRQVSEEADQDQASRKSSGKNIKSKKTCRN